MALPLRIEYPVDCYHLINLGNSGQSIIKRNKDKEKFTGYLIQMVEGFRKRLHCYRLIFNPYHLLIETPDVHFSKSIQWLDTGYAVMMKEDAALFGSFGSLC